MTEEQQRRLQRLKNYATAYEIEIRHSTDGRVHRICYSARHSRRGLLNAIQTAAEHIVKVTGTDNMYIEKKASDGVKIGDWRVKFSGRTERECILADAGELRWIGAVAREMAA